MARTVRIQTRLTLSRSFEAGSAGFKFGKYKLDPLPSTQPGITEAVLEFDDTFEAPIGGGSHPEEEANIVCNLLSLAMDARITRAGLRVNNIDIPINERSLVHVRGGSLSALSLEGHLRQVLSMPVDLARQLSRACRAFGSALHFIPSDPTFAFFLLVVAVECLSSQAAIISEQELSLDSKKCERFCRFIEQFLPDAARGDDERNSDLFRELLKTTYYSHRSSFVHGGREVSAASLMADRAGSSYFKHATDGREIRTPGLAWFASVVRGSLLGYLSSVPVEGAALQHDLLAQLAFEKAGLKMKVNKDVQAGHVVTLKDVEYR